VRQYSQGEERKPQKSSFLLIDHDNAKKYPKDNRPRRITRKDREYKDLRKQRASRLGGKEGRKKTTKAKVLHIYYKEVQKGGVGGVSVGRLGGF